MKYFTIMRGIIFTCAAFVIAACGGGGVGGIGSDSCQEDSATQNFAVAYVKRPAPTDDNGIPESRDYRDVTAFTPGAVLYVKKQATICAQAIDVTSREIGDTGDIRGVEISPDGSKVLFAMKEEDDDTDLDEETWNIWEYDIETNVLRKIITSPEAEVGQDIDPHYLADGRIIFSTDRQEGTIDVIRRERNVNDGTRRSVPRAINRNSDELSFNLYVMDDTGSGMQQLTFNQGHDLEPSLMEDGRVLFTRWEITRRNNNRNRSEFNLYTMNPDGTNVQLLYGRDSHQTGSNNDTIQFTQPRELEDGRVLSIIRPFDNTFEGGDIVLIDAISYVDNFTPLASTPTLTGPAQVSVTNKNVITAPGISKAGRFGSAYPFRDGSGRALVSWSICALDINGQLLANGTLSACTDENIANPAAVEVPPRYGLFVLDIGDKSFTPLVFPEAPVPNPDVPGAFNYYYYTDAVMAQDNFSPTFIPNSLSLAAEQTGVIHIKSVYDFGAPDSRGFFAPPSNSASIEEIRDPDIAPLYAEHPARFIRIVKPVLLPTDDELDLNQDAFGLSTANGMREIIGYAPIEPDGSAKFKVPADAPVMLSVLDDKGRRISDRHEFWITVRNGETLECIGCHVHDTDRPELNNVHGRLDAEPVSRNPGAIYVPAAPGYSFSPNTATTFVLNTLPGYTMAQARYPDFASTPNATPDIMFSDVWSAGATAALPAVNLLYEDLPAAVTRPVRSTCITNWESGCRVTINYVEHIAPLWSVDRGAGVTCIECHSDSDGANPMIPAAQLDLDDTAQSPDPDPNDYFMESYRELFFQDLAQFLDSMSNLVQQKTDGTGALLFLDNITGLETTSPTDADMNLNAPIEIDAPDVVMSIGGARASYFMQKMTGDDLGHTDRGNTVDHVGFMSPAELKLIAEWLDIGGQYYNNPFDAPP